MIIGNNEVTFEKHDMGFVKKFGLMNSSDMVLEYKERNNLPFIYDIEQLAHFLNKSSNCLYYTFRHIDEMYETIYIPKKNGKTRVLSVPCYLLKQFQKIILKKIIVNMPISEYAKAYHKGAKLVDNAAPHVGKKYLVKLDISDFFDNIAFPQIYSAVFNTKYFPKQIGVMLTAFCCYKDALPQGASTSPAISNIVMKRFDDYFGNWCKKQGFSYTRYCDDLTISGNTNLYPAFIKSKNHLEKMGFEINPNKTHFITNANRQSVTGITVNEKLNISKDYKRKLRQEIYYLFKYKEICLAYVNGEYPCFNSYINHVLGKVNYVLSVEPENSWFKDARRRLLSRNNINEYIYTFR